MTAGTATGSRGLTHLVSLQQPAGVEAHFTAFVTRAAARHPAWFHNWLNPARTMHPFFRAELEPVLAHTLRTKYRWGVKLPSRRLRTWHCRRACAASGTTLVVVWNRTARIGFVPDAVGPERCVHWEHGAAWHEGHERDRQRYLDRVPLVIANSTAAERVLRLVWSYGGEIRVCRNALRPNLAPAAPIAKNYPRGRIRLGIAARLFPVKGVPLALHALALLGRQGGDFELHVAGAGPELERLRQLAARLGVADRAHFRGAVSDMRAFYSHVHCLLHPPLTEAFGLVAIEAAAHGCPVLAAAVDGLPEAVADGVTGFCIPPTLPLAAYVDLGGSLDGVPGRVFAPDADAMREPRVVDPAALAAAVTRLFAEPREYERASRSASEHVLREFAFDAHVDDVMRVLAERAARV